MTRARPRVAAFTTTLLAIAFLGAVPRTASAKATFVVNNLDGPGGGFNDPTPVAPVGGNTGTTVGQQRLIAFKYAADIWGAALDSPIPIVIDATFEPLSCGAIIMLGHARAQNLFASLPGNPIPGLPMNLLYPEALADRLAGVDLEPGMADIVATFNGGLHQCDPNIDWYYGLDAKAGSLSDLVEIVVHELGHGLGFSSAVDVTSGAVSSIGIADTFTAHIYDNAMGMAWLDMNDAQRLASMRNVRHLVWTGDNAIHAASQVLSKGAPRLTPQSPVSAYLGNLGETNFGPLVKDVTRTLTGPLIIGSPTNGCSPLALATGGIVLLQGGSPCSPLNQADYATKAGAIAVLLTDSNIFSPPSSVELPPSQLSILPVHVPVVTVSVQDGDQLASGGSSVTLTLASDNTRLTGTDEMGRPYLYASDPIRPGSTISHWDPLARPDLIQEPESGYEHPHDITMEAALMRDIGWPTACGNGTLDPGEQCDKGASDNSDTAPDACRTTCLNAHCGDGVMDTGETCDLGSQNGAPGSMCSTTCTVVTPPPPDAGSGALGGMGAAGNGAAGSGTTDGGGGSGGGGGGRGCSCAIAPSSGGAAANLVAFAVIGALVMSARRRRR